MGELAIRWRIRRLKKTKYGYDVSVCDTRGAASLRFERGEEHGRRASFVLTREDLEVALKFIAGLGQVGPLFYVEGSVLSEKKGE